MTTQQQHEAITTSIDPATEIGLVSLSVADLDRSIAFYTDAMGFALLDRTDSAATLGVAGTPLLLLSEQKGARQWPVDGATGLYHFAVLVPSRSDLGHWLRNWLERGYPLPGQGDHLVSEALYIRDPDGHGIEVYRDRPRDSWTWQNGQVRMASDPVDMQGLLDDAASDSAPWTGLRAGTRLGHIHLQVGDIAQASTFYHDVLGFDIVARMPTALFISAGGYHHHIGLNTWHSRGAAPAPDDTATMRFYTIDLPTHEARAAVMARLAAASLPYDESHETVAVRDPWNNTILLHVGTVSDPTAAASLAANR